MGESDHLDEVDMSLQYRKDVGEARKFQVEGTETMPMERLVVRRLSLDLLKLDFKLPIEDI